MFDRHVEAFHFNLPTESQGRRWTSEQRKTTSITHGKPFSIQRVQYKFKVRPSKNLVFQYIRWPERIDKCIKKNQFCF